ncbi:Hypothetical protein Bdt_2090 [Bdellovibrio bacteriovorus str. Tiberius]|uniref:Uncharacterized protein n=1 Tax=Bdellovibrio bacteriovorus str. Tiberius TaxID=1069642 RepID=K7YPJ5_BDEBC|nr:Hypothetical protein Bdt_2090 [Bdellovibrio bacteriovorus str. Tiberius]
MDLRSDLHCGIFPLKTPFYGEIRRVTSICRTALGARNPPWVDLCPT